MVTCITSKESYTRHSTTGSPTPAPPVPAETRRDTESCEHGLCGQKAGGMRLLREHFAHYRPLVAATALGAAAAVHDQIADLLSQRRQADIITTVRDNALITLGRTFASINAAILAALASYRLSGDTHPAAKLWSCAVKAHGVDTAHQAVSELALLAGASGFVADSRTAKARRDLNALLYADGIHDSLLRSAGRALTLIHNSGTRSVTPPNRSPATPPCPQREHPGRPRPAGRSAATPC
jgi:alkylation response protein AidB-like acyl-CoA dehydrogenase